MIHLQNIKVIKKDKQIVTVHDLIVDRGKITAIIGPNGSGKSTLLKVMSLLENPTSGIIQFAGKQVFPGKINLRERRKVSVVFQQPLMLDTTVYNNVATGLKIRNTPKKVIHETVDYWLKKFGVDQLAQQRAKTLSGGEAQRVSIARAMATNPEVLFLDEPFSALDLPTRRKLLLDFQQILKETGTTTVFISHDYQEVKFLCDEMILMFEGQMVKKIKLADLHQEKEMQQGLKLFLNDWMTPLFNQ